MRKKHYGKDIVAVFLYSLSTLLIFWLSMCVINTGTDLMKPMPADLSWTEQNISHTMQTGDKIIIALQDWRRINGSWPQDLSALVPDYLSYLEAPSAGRPEWVYTYSNSSASLQFGMWNNNILDKFLCHSYTKIYTTI